MGKQYAAGKLLSFTSTRIDYCSQDVLDFRFQPLFF